MRKENSDASEMVSQLLFGELVEVQEVKENWTRIITYFDNYEAWVDTKQLIYASQKEVNRWLDGLSISTPLTQLIETPWGKQQIVRGGYLPVEQNNSFSIGNYSFSFVSDHQEEYQDQEEFAKSYLNSPYLWGGKSPFGIDCSGFVQQVFRFTNRQLPRDAYQQEELGENIDFQDRLGGDLAFFTNARGKVTHVGLILNDLQIIHASGWVRIDTLREDGIWNEIQANLTHHLHSIKRI